MAGTAARPSSIPSVRASCLAAAAAVSMVGIDEQALARLAQRCPEDVGEAGDWGGVYPSCPAHSAEDVAGYMLLTGALNFGFWEPEPRWRVNGWDGSYALVCALQRARQWGVAVGSPRWYAQLSEQGLRTILAGDEGGPPEPPLLEARLDIARELGRHILDEYAGSAMALLSVGSASEVAQRLGELTGFRDVVAFAGSEVSFLKRAQIAVFTARRCLGDSAPSGLHDLVGLTAFADYKVPQVLRSVGVLRYSAPLARAVDERRELAPGGEEEVSIRVMTVAAVDRLADRLRERGRRILPCDLDGWLWSLGQGRQMQPYHRTRTVWY